MIKFICTLLVTLSFSIVFCQTSSNKELTEAEKQKIRDNHKNGLTFKSKSTNNNNLNFTNTSEEEEKTTTTVKYYHGTQDTLYKEYKYIKED